MDWKNDPQYQNPHRNDQYGSDQRYGGQRHEQDRLQGGRERGREDERGFFQRAGEAVQRTGEVFQRATDEVRNWVGEAERRIDERRQEFGGAGHFEEMRAHEVMSRNVAAAHPQDSVERAARLMTDWDCGALPVVNDSGRLVGMITDRDITVRVVARGLDARNARVAQAMTCEAYACHGNDHVADCMRVMSRHQVRRIPVVDDVRRLVGIISQGDLALHAGAHQEPTERRELTDVLSAVSGPPHETRR
jgi:CBS domain-containing protein